VKPESWEAAKELLLRLQPLSSAERAALLDTLDDAELRAEVESLLAAAERAEPGFLETPELADFGLRLDPSLPRKLGEFELLKELGRGGNGVVYLARQSDLDRLVAVKVLPIGFTTSQKQLARFVNEAMISARLDHPGIVKVFTIGEEAGAHYFAMEYVRNGSLADELERQRQGRNGQLPAPGAPDHLQQCARRIAELAGALQSVHDLRVWHRDLKPHNILIGDQKELRLVDFGLAKELGAESLSRSDEILGTPHYMSPEQARASAAVIDHRTDVYSLGVVLYEMLTLQRPFSGISSDEIVWQILHREPADVRTRNPRVPRDLAVITATAMAKAPEARYANARAFADDLERFLRYEPIVARPPGVLERARRFAHRHRLGLATAGLLAAGALGGRTWMIEAQERSLGNEASEQARRLLEAPEWAALEDELLIGGRAALATLEEYDQEPELRARLEERFDALHAELLAEGRAKIAHGREAVAPERIGSVDDAEVLEGFLRIARGVKLFPDSRALAAELRTDTFHPRVSVRAVDQAGEAQSGTVAYRVLDPASGVPGPRVPLGVLPVEAQPLPPGFYRFTLEVPGRAHREFTRLLVRGRDLQPIVCTLRDDGERLAGMRRIESGTLTLPGEGDPCPLNGRSVEVEAFYLDEAEVSNREFRRYLEATGAPEPGDWAYLPADGSFDERPVVTVGWYEAQAYAEWAGKRLVGHAEWELAARGPSGAFLAALAPDADGYGGNVYGGEVPGGSFEELFRRSLEGTMDVRDPRGLDANGLYHLLGNVREWCDSLGYEDVDGTYEPRAERRLALSSPWFARARKMHLDQHFLEGPERSYARAELGFRCARSAQP